MTPTILAAAALALSTVTISAAAAAERPEMPVTATYHPATQRYCVRPQTPVEAVSIGVGLYQRQCMIARHWRQRGVTFAPPRRTAVLAGM